MTVENIIQTIISILNEPNIYPNDDLPSIYQFTYSRNIKTEEDLKSNKLRNNPSISLIGEDKINRYIEQFKSLYKIMDINKYHLSFNKFKKLVEQYFFEGEIKKEKIIEEIKLINHSSVINIARIYGVKLNINELRFGKYLLINKNYMLEYLQLQTEYPKDDKWYNSTKEYFENHAKDIKDFVYCVCIYEARDIEYANELFIKDKTIFINILRYMMGIKHKRVYIDHIKFTDYSIDTIQIKNKKISQGRSLEFKDISIELNDEFFLSKENSNYYIWEITKKSNYNKLEKKILRAIEWIGISVSELNNEIACTEVAFAFEALLRIDESRTPITSSIQGRISDMVAFIIGNNYEERMKIIKTFTDFYSYRSAVAHGGETSKQGNYFEYLYLFKNTLKEILTNKEFKDCRSIEQLDEKIKKIKYK